MGKKKAHPIRPPLLLAALLSMGGVAADDEEPGVPIVKEWTGANAKREAPGRVVAGDQESWKKIWSGMTGNTRPQAATPKIDFGKQQVLAVFMGRRNTGGYSVKIVRIEDKTKRVVTVRESSPPPDAMVTMALTSPYHVVVVPKTSKKVEFVDRKAAPKK